MPFDLKQLAAMLGGAQPQGGAFLRGFQRGMQEIQARKQQQQQGDVQQQQLMLQSEANRRANAADERAGQDQLLQTVSQVRGGLEGAGDEAALESLMNFYTNLAPRLGIEPGFVQAEATRVRKLLPQKQAKAAYDSITKGLTNEEVQQLREQPVTYRVSGTQPGQEVTFAQLEQQARGMPEGVSLKRAAPKPEVPNTPEEQFYQRYAAEKGAATFGELPTADQAAARKQWMQADDRPQQSGEMTEIRRVSTFNQIVGNYQRSPLIRAADRTIVLDDAIKTIEQNPSDPAAQLRLAYSYIQALDTYQSAVREGELGNLGVLGTKLQQWATQLNRVAFEGAFLPPAVAKNIAADAKQLAQVIASGRSSKEREFASQADVAGVGDMWKRYTAGFAPPPPTPPSPETPAAPAPTQPRTPRPNPFRGSNARPR